MSDVDNAPTDLARLREVILNALDRDGQHEWEETARLADLLAATVWNELHTFPLARTLDATLQGLIDAIPHKRWWITLDGDWEDGWVASARGRTGVDGDYLDASTAGQGWMTDRGGVETPEEAVRKLTELLTSLEA